MDLKYIKKGKFSEVFNKIIAEDKKEQIADDIAQKASKVVKDLNDELEDDAFANMDWDDNDVIETDPSSGLGKFTYMRLHDFISLSYRTKQPLLIYGDPGIGKSQMVQQFVRQTAKAKSKEFVDWDEASESKQREVIKDPSNYFLYIDARADSLDPTDLGGIPNLQNKEEWLETQMPKWLYVMAQPNADGILFLDELNNAEPPMLKALYKVVDKKVGNIKLAPDFGVVAAGNLGAEFGGNPLPWALTNRFESGVLIADPEQWLDYAEHVGVDNRILAFVKSNPEENFNPKPPGGFTSGETHKTWASPRAIMMLSNKIKELDKAYAGAQKEGQPIKTPKILAIKQSAVQICGEIWARGFDAFMKHFRSFDYANIVKMADDNLLQKEDRDKLHALLLFVLAKLKPALVRSTKNEIDEQNFSHISEEDKGVIVGVAKISNSFKPEWKVNLFSHFKKDIPIDQLELMMTFLLRGDYDDKTKQTYKDVTLPKVKEVLKR